MSDNLENKLEFSKEEKVCFINYDYKNALEEFKSKSNNPLVFPNKILATVENTLLVSDLNKLPQATLQIPKIKISPTVTKTQYLKKINALKQHIKQGNIYEINFCITFEAKNVLINPVDVYRKLHSISDAPYSSIAKFNHQYIISSSPELYIKKEKQTLVSKPIKGTAKRGLTPEQDNVLKKELQQSLKERTENVMIVDVVRNDLSNLAKKGTVNVDKLFDIESYKQVHQMVSTVSCELKKDTSFNDIIEATFPMASMTGAPKIRAMQLSDEFEYYNRGPYSGCLGLIKKNNDFELSVLIRSIFYDEKKQYLSFSVGSAITSLCNAEDEYEECLLKAKAMMQVLQD